MQFVVFPIGRLIYFIYSGTGSYITDCQLHQRKVTERFSGGKWGHHSASLKVKATAIANEPLHEKKQYFGFPGRSDTNQQVKLFITKIEI